MIEFNEAEHTYTVDGVSVPNVTSILSPISAYRNFDAKKMDAARQKGVAIHKMVELSCKGTLDVLGLPGWMKPAYSEWIKFVGISQFQVESSELKVYHPTYRYAGTMDLYGSIVVAKGKRMSCYIDIKRSLLGGDTIGYQLAAYAEAHRMMMTKAPISPFKRLALVIREDGHFKLQEYTDTKDYYSFITCLSWQRLCEKHNIK